MPFHTIWIAVQICESDMTTNKSPFSEIVKQRIKYEKLSFLLFEAAEINNAHTRSAKNPFCENLSFRVWFKFGYLLTNKHS